MGAVAISNREDDIQDNKRVVEADVTFSASYATGGDTLSKSALGLTQIDDARVLSLKNRKGVALTPHGRQIVLGGTAAAPTLKLYAGSGSEVAAASNNSTVVARVRFVGY